jgi:hypothetical protein
MSFKAVWGFDPEEIEKAKQRCQLADDSPCELGAERPNWDFASDDWAEIPSRVEAQINELRRMFRLLRK